MRIKDSKIAMSLVAYSILGWPALLIFGNELPAIVRGGLAISLFFVLLIIPIIGIYLHLVDETKQMRISNLTAWKYSIPFTIVMTVIITSFILAKYWQQ